MRSLLVAIAKLPWQATGEHPAIEYLAKLQALYLKGSRKLPVEVVAPSLGNDLAGFDLQPRPGTGVSGVGGGHPVCPAPRGAQWLGLD